MGKIEPLSLRISERIGKLIPVPGLVHLSAMNIYLLFVSPHQRLADQVVSRGAWLGSTD
jgi:hypothetical protein